MLPRKFLENDTNDSQGSISTGVIDYAKFLSSINWRMCGQSKFTYFFSFPRWDQGMVLKYIENMFNPYLEPSQTVLWNQAFNQLFMNDAVFRLLTFHALFALNIVLWIDYPKDTKSRGAWCNHFVPIENIPFLSLLRWSNFVPGISKDLTPFWNLRTFLSYVFWVSHRYMRVLIYIIK